MKKFLKIGLLVLMLAIVLPSFANAQSATGSFAWEASTSTPLTGYKLYWGSTSRTYTANKELGVVLTGTINTMPNTGPIYTAVTAFYNDTAAGIYRESDYSNEVLGWTINAKADANSTITNSGIKVIGQNNTVTYTFSANTGYNIVSVKVDGVAINNPGTSYTFASIAANHTIEIITEQKYVPPKNLKITQLMEYINYGWSNVGVYKKYQN